MAKELVIGGGMLEELAGELNAKLVDVRTARAKRLEALESQEELSEEDAHTVVLLKMPIEDYEPANLKIGVSENLIAPINQVKTAPDGRLIGRKITEIMELESTIKKLRKFEDEGVFSVILDDKEYDMLKAGFEAFEWVADNDFSKKPLMAAYKVLHDAGEPEGKKEA